MLLKPRGTRKVEQGDKARVELFTKQPFGNAELHAIACLSTVLLAEDRPNRLVEERLVADRCWQTGLRGQ